MTINNDDNEAFKKAMQSIKPLKPDNKLGHIKPISKTWKKKTAVDTKLTDMKISDSEIETVTAETVLHFCQHGIQPRYFKKLRSGNLAIEALLDLHGFTIDQARTELLNFIEQSQQNSLRTVKIIHGKSFTAQTNKPIIKNKVNTWLQQLPTVLAFCSCQPKDGGTGAVYVLLKRN